MHYLVDGHNLIGQSRSISLGDPDDEAKLVTLLHRWALRHKQMSLTVVFDGGVYGHPQNLSRPHVRVLFARSPQDADARLIHLIKAVDDPRRFCLVTSDRLVAAEAIARGMRVQDSRSFSMELEAPQSSARRAAPLRRPPEHRLTPAEVDEWMRLFGADSPTDD